MGHGIAWRVARVEKGKRGMKRTGNRERAGRGPMRAAAPFGVALAGVLAVAGLGAPAPALASEPVALVEGLSQPRDDLQLMDYLEAGRTFDLAAGETVEIGYLLSCVHEEITGGTVTVGADESDVEGGEVARSLVDCDGGSVALAEGQGQQAGAAAFRAGDSGDLPPPDRLIYGLSPILKFAGTPAPVTIRRLDSEAPEIDVAAADPVVDLRAQGIALSPGATYAFVAGERTLVIAVSKFASEDAPAVSRLVPM